jgi:hypothetical protein
MEQLTAPLLLQMLAPTGIQSLFAVHPLGEGRYSI